MANEAIKLNPVDKRQRDNEERARKNAEYAAEKSRKLDAKVEKAKNPDTALVMAKTRDMREFANLSSDMDFALGELRRNVGFPGKATFGELETIITAKGMIVHAMVCLHYQASILSGKNYRAPFGFKKPSVSDLHIVLKGLKEMNDAINILAEEQEALRAETAREEANATPARERRAKKPAADADAGALDGESELTLAAAA